MIDIIIEDIIGYITDDLNHEDRDFRNLIYFINNNMKRSKRKTWSKEGKNFKELLIMDLIKYRGLIEQIKEIRDIYQKGKRFANNQTKGSIKQLTPINMRIHSIQFYLNQNNIEKAKEEAKFQLESIHRLYSERTYYRMKARIKDMGVYPI